MLDACVALVDEVGYDGLNTTVIAHRARFSVGAVYRFFSDVRAVVRAARRRNSQRYLERLNDRFFASAPAHWWDGAEAALDEYIAMHRDTPGCRALLRADVDDVDLLTEERDHLGDQVSRVIVEQYGIDDERVRFALRIAVVASDSLIMLAFRHNSDGDPEVLAEAKVLVRRYLQRYLATPVPAGGPDGGAPPPVPDGRSQPFRQQATATCGGDAR
ncbi:TetR family transcriptional regulator [Solwaraspora sp. WMMD1047]|uniref:TetR family transcriptional regulator n=1 Tax=Solwaraspora sp. WMMD1047 TaxID=3016102 RepID=UPI0032429782